HRGERRQLAARLRPPGRIGEHPHGPRAARSLRLGRPQEGGGSMNLALEVMIGGVRGGTSILYAGLGETMSERAGVVNLGIEGSMLCGALAAYAANAASGNPWVGAAGGAAAGGALALVHGYFVLGRKTNQLATGLVVLFLALGITSLFGA